MCDADRDGIENIWYLICSCLLKKESFKKSVKPTFHNGSVDLVSQDLDFYPQGNFPPWWRKQSTVKIQVFLSYLPAALVYNLMEKKWASWSTWNFLFQQLDLVREKFSRQQLPSSPKKESI